MPFQKGHKRVGGRKKGMSNHSKFAEGVYIELERKHGINERGISIQLLTCDIPPVVQKEHARLQEYKYGKMIQTEEHTGKDGSVIRVVVEHIGQSKNQAPAEAK